MKKPTKKQIEKLNKIIVHCSWPSKENDNVYMPKNIPLGNLVEGIVNVLNEKEEKK